MIDIIPAIDVIGGRCVRLAQGDFARKTVYDANPINAAKRFRDAGLKRLHMVDLDGARTGGPKNLSTLESVSVIADDIVIDYGGGVRTNEDVADVLSAGASFVNIGSLTVKEPELFAEMVRRFGAEKFLPGADARGGMAAVSGWRTVTNTPVRELLLRFAGLGIREAFVTDVASDGMMLGPAVGFYRELLNAAPGIGLIASGGVRGIDDVHELEDAGCTGVIVGKAFYEGTITLKEISKYVGKANSAVSRR